MTLSIAIAERDATALPGRRDEAWRYSDLRGLLRAVPEPSPEGGPVARAAPLNEIAADHEIVLVNGRCGQDRFVAEAGRPRVLRLRFVSQAEGTAHQARFAIEVPAGAVLTLIESYEGEGSAYLANAALDITLRQDAALERIVVTDEAADAVSLSRAEVVLSPAARFSQTVLTTGARLQRLETHVAHPGGHAQARLDGVYLLDERRHADITTVLVHAGTDGVTSQLTKGVVRDRARGVFQGRIVVSPGADRTDARMGHHALLLGEGAEVDAKPELEIYADDVSCAHGNTVGALDDEALFYMRSRGLSELQARALLMQAFMGEVVDRIEHPLAREAAQAWLARALEAGA